MIGFGHILVWGLAHYTFRLVLIPNVAIYQIKPATTSRPRSIRQSTILSGLQGRPARLFGPGFLRSFVRRLFRTISPIKARRLSTDFATFAFKAGNFLIIYVVSGVG